MKTLKFLTSTLMAFGFLAVSHSAAADGWPSSIVGNWSVNANNSVGTLSVTSQSSVGNCRKITGSIFGQPIQGFYCPFSGRVHFLRKTAANNDTFQVYSANLSQASAGVVLRMGGLFSDFGQPGEYSFFASKS